MQPERHALKVSSPLNAERERLYNMDEILNLIREKLLETAKEEKIRGDVLIEERGLFDYKTQRSFGVYEGIAYALGVLDGIKTKKIENK